MIMNESIVLSNSLIHTVTKNKPEVLLIKTTLQWTLDNNIQIHPHNLVINCTFSFVLAPLVDLSIFTTDKQCSTVPRSLASLKFAVCVKNKPLKQKVRDYEMQCVANNLKDQVGTSLWLSVLNTKTSFFPQLLTPYRQC